MRPTRDRGTAFVRDGALRPPGILKGPGAQPGRGAVSGTAPASSEPAVPDVPEAIWLALDDAITIVRVAYDGPARRDELARFLVQVRSAVEQLIAGRPMQPPVTRTLPAVRILDRLQRELVARLVAERSCDPALALRLLGAVGAVQSSYEEIDAGRQDFQHLSGREAVGLLVEVAHDMRSPLSAVLFLVDMLRTGRSGPVSALQARQLCLVYGAAFGLSQLATDLIDHVHGQERLVDRHPVPFSISETLNSVRDIVAPMAEEKGLAVRLSAPCDDARLGFPVALHRILLNLASNAVKYTSRGEVGLESSEVSASRVRFAVTDTGPGMPRRVVAQLFEPFRSTPGAELPSFSGSGLGLSISKRLVTLLGGDLRVVTAVGKGTRFSFELDLPEVAKR